MGRILLAWLVQNVNRASDPPNAIPSGIEAAVIHRSRLCVPHAAYFCYWDLAKNG